MANRLSAGMQCQRCACHNPAGSRFCRHCAHPLGAVCQACGRNCAYDARFCGGCGADLHDGTLAREPGGERKQATVLFADIVESTQLIAGLDAEDAMERLQPVIAAMVQQVRRFNGVVLHTLGDGIKAAFGAFHALEGHALLACQAAIAIRDAVACLSSAPRVRVGVHSGEVVAGVIDIGSAFEHEAQGMTAHLASRLEQLAEPGSICISHDCRMLVGAYCDTVALGSRTLKGIPQPIEVYRLIGMRPAVASDHFRGRELTRLFGRAEEFDYLKSALLAARHGTPSVIGISAPAGLGKSRLCFELSEWCRGQQIRVIEARGHVFGQATPLQPVLEMLRSFLRISPFDGPEASENIARRMVSLDAEFAPDIPILCDFLGVSVSDQAAASLDPRTRYARLRDIVHRMVKAAGRQSLLILIEDLHWLDEASCDFVESMVAALDGTQTVVVVNFRPPWSATWTGQRCYRELQLKGLGPTEILDLVRDLVGDGQELADLAADIASRSDGNPFFAEELVFSLVQRGVLLGGRGDYRLSSSGWDSTVLPATIEAVIGARLDRLSEPEKAVLQIAAVVGKEFPLDVIRRVIRLPEHELRHLLDHLCVAELIQGSTTAVGPGFAFRHPLLQQVAYATQLRSRRVKLHAAVAEAIESHPWGQLDEFASLLSHHCEASGQPLEAAKHLQRAALWVGRTSSSRALADWKKMHRLLRDQPHTGSIDRLRALASGRIVGFGWREGMTGEEAKPYAEEALRLAREAGDQKHATLLLGSYGRILASTGSVNEYIALVRQALVRAKDDGDPEGSITFNGMLSQAYLLAGLFREALAANETALEAIEDQSQQQGGVVLGLTVDQLLGFDVIHWIRCQRARILFYLGQLDEVDRWLPRVLQVDPRRIDPVVHFIPHAVSVELAWHRGESSIARSHAREVAGYATQSAMPYLRVIELFCNGLSASVSGDFVMALNSFEDALTTARRTRAGMEFEARIFTLLADTHARAGDQQRAVEQARRAIDVARLRTDRFSECQASIIAAKALSAGSAVARREEAGNLLARAERLLAETGAGILQPLLQEELARVDASE
jgi:class 3 adenylate cyclase/tetratricopeptide (TPR) repeat protein